MQLLVLLGLGNQQRISNISNYSIKQAINEDKKEGFICNIIKKYGVGDDSPYSIDFVSPVERFDGHMESKNVVLTYSPHKK